MSKLNILFWNILHVIINSLWVSFVFGFMGSVLLFPLTILAISLGGFKSVLLLFEVYATLGLVLGFLSSLEDIL